MLNKSWNHEKNKNKKKKIQSDLKESETCLCKVLSEVVQED